MKKIFVLTAFVAVLPVLFAYDTLDAWKLKENYRVKFTNDDVTGIFRKMQADVRFNEGDLTSSSISVVIDAASINTGNATKNNNAKGEEWLDVSKYPTIRFASSAVVKSGSGFLAKGVLELHGVTKNMDVPFTFKTVKANEGLFEAKFNIDIEAYDIWNPDGIDNMLQLEISVPVLK